MDKLYFGEKLPIGFCDECLARMAGGAPYEATKIGHEAHLVHAYCSHQEAGATIMLRPGRPRRWHIISSIDAIDWQRHVVLQTVMLTKAQRESAAELALGASTEAHAALPAKELLN